MAARPQWWTHVVSVDSVRLNDDTHLLWGDRVVVTSDDGTTAQVRARGTSGSVPLDALQGEPLLEFYFVDVGQGDGVLMVTPEGKHVMIDGGYPRSLQQTGKSASDFVDWKFHKDYLLTDADRADPSLNEIRLDLMVATHADIDHYGGLTDALSPRTPEGRDELDTLETKVERFIHPGLSPQGSHDKDLGPKTDNHFTRLLGDRASAEDAVLDSPNGQLALRGKWKDFIRAVTETTTVAGAPTPIERVSDRTGLLSGWEVTEPVSIEVLAPAVADVGGGEALKDIGDFGENKNGHSIALRVAYGNRTFLLAGDLNDKSQPELMNHYGATFAGRWQVDVAKACHHGSHHADFDFMRGLSPVCTIFSSGDANTHDHPRPWVLAAAGLAGRVAVDGDRLVAPLVYSTEIARSIDLSRIDQLRRYQQVQQWKTEEGDSLDQVSGDQTLGKWRIVLDRDVAKPSSMQPARHARVMEKLVYGLINVRTDGDRLLFAIRNEGNATWSIETLEAAQIDAAVQWIPGP